MRFSQARSYVGGLVSQARDFIFNLGYNVASAAVERLLSTASWVPTLARNFIKIIENAADICQRMLLPRN